MIQTTIECKCKICSKSNFYIMPLKKKVNNNDFINVINKYNLQCKNCGKNYILTFNIKAI